MDSNDVGLTPRSIPRYGALTNDEAQGIIGMYAIYDTETELFFKDNNTWSTVGSCYEPEAISNMHQDQHITRASYGFIKGVTAGRLIDADMGLDRVRFVPIVDANERGGILDFTLAFKLEEW